MDNVEGTGDDSSLPPDDSEKAPEKEALKSQPGSNGKGMGGQDISAPKSKEIGKEKSAPKIKKRDQEKLELKAKEPRKEKPAPKSKELPDISKLSGARPTKVPRTAKEKEELEQPKRPRPNWKWMAAAVAAVTCIIGAVYANSIYGSAVFNDQFNFNFIAAAMEQQTYWFQHWVDAFRQPFSQPWVQATYGWDLTSFNWNAGWSHTVNVVLHLTASLYLYTLVFMIARRLKLEGRLTPSPYIIAFAAAALFAVHPLATGSIAYISGRTGPLLAVNYFLALNLFVIGYLSEVINFALIAYMLFFTFNVVALFCNVQAVTLPLSAVLIGLLLKDPKQAWKEWRDSRGYELIFFFLAAIGEPFLLLLGVPKLTDNGLGLHVLPAASYVASQFKLLVTYYLRCFLIPYGLTTDPANVVASGLSDPLALLGLAVMAGAAAAAWIWRQQTFLVLGLALFLLGLFPANLLVQAELVADQRFYLSLAGLCLAGGWGLAEFYTRNKRAAGAVGLILLLGWGALTVLRNRQWATDELLWQQAIKLNPDSARAHALYAKSLKKPEDAYKEAKRALELDPKNVIALQSVADYDLSREKYAETEDALQTAISISLRENVSAVDLANLQERLAKCYVKENKLDKADALAKEVLRVLPEDTGMNIVVAQALIARKNYILAFTTLAPNLTENPALGKDPDYMRALAEAGLNSGVARWMEQGLLAALQYTKLSPGRDSRIFLTKCLLGMNEPLQALEAIEPIVKLANDKDAEADYLKALALEGIKHSEQAQEEKELALKLDPKIAEKVVIKKLKSPAKSAPDGKSRMQPGMAPPSPGVIPELRPAQQPAATAKPADTKSSTTTSTSTGH